MPMADIPLKKFLIPYHGLFVAVKFALFEM